MSPAKLRMLTGFVLPFIGPLLCAQNLTLDSTTLTVGEHLSAHYDGSTTTTDWVGIYEQGGAGTEYIYWLYTSGSQTASGQVIPSGDLTFTPVSLQPGNYAARYYAENGYTMLDEVAFEILSPTNDDAPDPTGDLTVMSFNIWVNGASGYGGLNAVADAVIKCKPDVIGFQECSSASLAQILSRLQEDPYYSQAQASNAAGIISRYPISATYTASGLWGYGARVEVPDVGSVRVFNCHLSAYPYGPYSAQAGNSLESILQDEHDTRGAQTLAILAQLIDHPAMNPELPTLFVGDHNTPNGSDWGPSNSEQNFGYVIDWPVGQHCAAAGFIDCFRTVHPDPIGDRGYTWTPGQPKDTLPYDDVHDRIDMIYMRPAPGARPTILQAYVFDADPWPSDHRAVVASMNLDSCPDPIPYCTAKAHSGGSEPLIGWSGEATLSADDFRLEITGALAGQFGLAFYSPTGPHDVPFFGGTLCALPPLQRLDVITLDGAGAGGYDIPMTSAWLDTSRWFQFWFRDPQHPDGTGVGITAGLKVTPCVD
jgi:endonuclease/exonuclease/phosphatase family metal-dependent hydrolase